MSSLPVDLKDRSYNHSDFVGKGYVESYSAFLADASYSLLHPLLGACTTAVPLLPAFKQVTLTCSRNRAWTTGMSLIFQGVNSAQTFVLKVKSYGPQNGELTGTITNVSSYDPKRLLGVGGVRSDTQWLISVAGFRTYDYSRNNGSELPVASGGIGAKLSNEANDARAALGMDSFGLATLKAEDDFFGMGEYTIPGENGSSIFTITGFQRPVAADPFADWGMLKADIAAVASYATITGSVQAPLRITTNANTDFMIATRVYLSALNTGGEKLELLFGYGQTAPSGINKVELVYDTDISANWQYVTVDATTPSQSTSAVPVVAGAFVELMIAKVAGTITFYVNGAAIGTKTTNFPAVAVYPYLHVVKTVGSAARYILCDYLRLNHRAGP